MYSTIGEKYRTHIFFIGFLVVFILCVQKYAYSANTQEYRLVSGDVKTVSRVVSKKIYSFKDDFVIKIPTKNVSVRSVKGKAVFVGAATRNLPCHPALPVQEVKFLLPDFADLKTVRVSLKALKEQTIKGRWDIEPALPFILGNETMWPEKSKILNGRDVSVYSKNEFMPAKYHGEAATGKLRSFKIATVQIYPYR